jgi:hypothetical protein
LLLFGHSNTERGYLSVLQSKLALLGVEALLSNADREPSELFVLQ